MRNADGRTDHEGHVETLGKIEGLAGERERFGRIGGFEHRDARGERVEAGVLLVLGGMHARVVRGQNDETAVHAGVGHREKRVGRDVHAHVLHRGKHARARSAGACADLDGDLLVRAPLSVDPVFFRKLLHRLGRGSAWVGNADARARFPCALGNSLVS